MPDAVLDMRFAHYLEDFADDEGFLQATHQAGLQVEKKKTLKAAREAMRGPARDAVRATPVPAAKREEGKKEERRPTTNREPGKNDS